jgi:hypothetical protein
MRAAMFGVHAVDRECFDEANVGRGHDLHYLEARLAHGAGALPLSAEEEAGIEAALESYRQGRAVDSKRAREIIDAALGR